MCRAGILVPFMAVYPPALMLQGGTWFDTAYVAIKAVIAICLWGGAASGWLLGRMGWIERLWATAAAFLFVVAYPATDEIAAALTIARSEEHTSELQSLMRISYAVFCLKKKTQN